MGHILKLCGMAACLMALAGLDAFVEAQGPLAHDTQINANKGGKRLVIQTKAGAVNFASAGFVQVTATGITIPAAQSGILVATFTAESDCNGGSWCSVRIVCDGIELQPAVGTDFAFDAPGDSWDSNSVTRRTNVLTGGSHTCEVQTAQVGGSNLRLDDWTFVVEYWRTN